MDASFDYLNFDSDEEQFIYSSFRNRINQAERQDSIRGDIRENINLYAGQVNLKLPFDNGWTLNAGVKSSYVSIDNHALYANREQDTWSSDKKLTQGFSYQENINAACDSSFSDHSIDLFPTVFLEHPLGKGKLFLFYGKRINRPNYGDLNPSTYSRHFFLLAFQ